MRDQTMRAWLDAPVREAAIVSVNGKAAGSVWRPPYRVDLGGLLHARENRICIEVGTYRPRAPYKPITLGTLAGTLAGGIADTGTGLA